MSQKLGESKFVNNFKTSTYLSNNQNQIASPDTFQRYKKNQDSVSRMKFSSIKEVE